MKQECYSTKRVTVWDAEKGGQPGKAILYQDGYQSWCPDAVYARDYQPVTAMSFGHAIAALKAGDRVARAGWNGRGMFLFLVPGIRLTANSSEAVLGYRPETDEIDYCPHIDMRTVDGKVVPWLASQTDMLADDWRIVSGEAAP